MDESKRKGRDIAAGRIAQNHPNTNQLKEPVLRDGSIQAVGLGEEVVMGEYGEGGEEGEEDPRVWGGGLGLCWRRYRGRVGWGLERGDYAQRGEEWDSIGGTVTDGGRKGRGFAWEILEEVFKPCIT